MLGVATLIIVMAVMNGFRAQLIDKILGLNGAHHLPGAGHELTDYADVAERIAGVPGVVSAIPLVEGQALATGTNNSSGALVRGVRQQDLAARSRPSPQRRSATLDNFDPSQGVAIGTRLAASSGSPSATALPWSRRAAA